MAASAMPVPIARTTKIVLITANKGGCGKTTTSINLSTAAAHAGYRVMGIDFDPQRNFANWATRRADAAYDGVPHVPVASLNLDRFRGEFPEITGYDYVIIDTPPGVGEHSLAMTTLIERADLVLIPTGIGFFDVEVVSRYAVALRNLTRQRPTFVLNRIDTRLKESERGENVSLLMRAGRVSNTVVPTLVDIERHMRDGLSIVDINARRGVDNVRALWTYVEQELAHA